MRTVTAIALGMFLACFACVHTSQAGVTGSIVAWGDNDLGQCDVPSGSDFVAVAAGVGHSLALREDGSLAAWGYNAHGQCNVPAGSDFVAVAAGASHGLALKEDGSLAAWAPIPTASATSRAALSRPSRPETTIAWH